MGSRLQAFRDTLNQLLRDYSGRLTALCMAVFAFGFAIGPATVLMSKYLQQDHHYSPGEVSILYLFGGFVAVVGNVVAGRLSDRFGRRRILFATAMLSGICFAVFFSGVGGFILPVMWIAALFGFLSADALFSGYPPEIFPTATRATAAGLRYALMILGGALSLALEGVFYDWLGGHGPAIMLALAAMPVALAAILFLPETARRTLEEISGNKP
jgi:MFS family permease